MKEVVVISGKGGTGKTTVTANLAVLAENFVLADCDVDAPNLHILLKPQIIEDEPFYGGNIAVRNDDLCISCGLCHALCRFDAIASDGTIDSLKCEGCNLCVVKCPMGALKLVSQQTGNLYFSQTEVAPMVHARLKAGGENSGKLVTQVKQNAQKVAQEYQKDWLLIDGSPGIGCPTIASLKGVDIALVVTEASVSGFSDLKRLLQLVQQFRTKALVVINKFDLNLKLTEEIEEFCQNQGISVIGRIPFSEEMMAVLRRGEILVRQSQPNVVGDALRDIWQQLKANLFTESKQV